MTKVSKTKKSGIVYETAAPNIQKQINTATGAVKYRVRFGTPNGEISEYATSMKKAYEVRKRLAA